MRKYNTQNLTREGDRKLRLSAKLADADELIIELKKVAQFMASEVKAEVMNRAITHLRKQARHYIREGKTRTGINSKLNPRSQGLEDSFRAVSRETDTEQVSMGEGIVYAQLHNLPPGETRTITANNPGEKLVFMWLGKRFTGKLTRVYSVERGGVGYWDQAIRDVENKMHDFWSESIEDVRKTMDSNTFRLDARTGVKARLSRNNSAKARSAR